MNTAEKRNFGNIVPEVVEALPLNAIHPGAVETEFSIVRFKGDTQKAKDIYKGAQPLKAEDIANTILWVIKQPAHVNVDKIELMPLDQTFGGVVINRKEK
jgi:3-hydroxy acid dehydrogenase/malonic semialdehyde reductase